MSKKALIDRLYEIEKRLYYSKHYNYERHQKIVKMITSLESK